MFGGAERYLIELDKILRNMGYTLEIYQAANFTWVSSFEGIKVIGINTEGDIGFLNQRFHDWVPSGALTIYSPYTLGFPKHKNPSIGICHGIYWDHRNYHESWQTLKRTVVHTIEPLKNIDHFISVDTNTINWLRTVAYDQTAKCKYIPNFVDTEIYKPNKDPKDHDNLIILYPRRLYEPRGFWLVRDIIPKALEEYPSLKFLFVGQADQTEKGEIQKIKDRYPSNVEWKTVAPDAMDEIYKQADITIIPTIYSEGTSLACLEALASGNSVIASNVGGLPNLIIDHYNGLLINPDPDNLLAAIKELIENPILREELAVNGRVSAQAFGINRWREKWHSLLEQTLQNFDKK